MSFQCTNAVYHEVSMICHSASLLKRRFLQLLRKFRSHTVCWPKSWYRLCPSQSRQYSRHMRLPFLTVGQESHCNLPHAQSPLHPFNSNTHSNWSFPPYWSVKTVFWPLPLLWVPCFGMVSVDSSSVFSVTWEKSMSSSCISGRAETVYVSPWDRYCLIWSNQDWCHNCLCPKGAYLSDHSHCLCPIFQALLYLLLSSRAIGTSIA